MDLEVSNITAPHSKLINVCLLSRCDRRPSVGDSDNSKLIKVILDTSDGFRVRFFGGYTIKGLMIGRGETEYLDKSFSLWRMDNVSLCCGLVDA